MNGRVLCVDDELDILQALRRQFRGRLELEVAAGPEQGLAAVREAGPYAVVVADMCMPGMDGASFLAEVQRRAPDTVRIMLTGNADGTTAVEAVNKGSIFRFLSKPCAPEDFLQAVQQGIEIYNTTRADRELLETTLSGCIQVLSEIIALFPAHQAGSATRLREVALELARELGTVQLWQLDVASMLCRLGMVTLPPDVLAHSGEGPALAPAARELLARVPEVGHRLLSRIPRLEEVARIVLYQDRGFDGSGTPDDGPVGAALPEGSRILKCAGEYVRALEAGLESGQALAALRARASLFDPAVLAALERCCARELAHRSRRVLREVELRELRAGQVTAAPILTRDGRLLLREGYALSEIVLERIRNLARLQGVRQPILIQEPS